MRGRFESARKPWAGTAMLTTAIGIVMLAQETFSRPQPPNRTARVGSAAITRSTETTAFLP